jgi:hypothetical protein
MKMSSWQTELAKHGFKMKDLLAWFRTARHPHRKCTNALVRKGMPKERAVRICARAKDMALGTTKWRNSSK